MGGPESPHSFAVAQPVCLAELIGLRGIFVAAGTALQLAWGDQPPDDDLIDISHLVEARGISLSASGLRLGALETLETCRTNDLVLSQANLLAQACAAVGALGVRNLATLGGNLGWRQGDTIPALLSLGAWVEIPSGNQSLADALAQRTMPLILAIRIPPQPPGSVIVFEKIGHRAAFSPSVATVAGSVRRDQSGRIIAARLAAGGAGLPARTLPDSAAYLTHADPQQVRFWPALAARIAAELGGETNGVVAGRVLSGRLRDTLAV